VAQVHAGNSVQRDLDEIKALALRYIKEETIQPIKEMGASFSGSRGQPARGLRLLLLALRGTAILTGPVQVLDGSLSWIPYLIVVVLAALVMALTVWRIVSGTAKRRLKDTK